jgi:hypothetical protein
VIPDYCEALTAWRVWDVYANGLLTGQAVHEPWPPYEPLRATCANVQHDGAKAHLRDGRYLPAPRRRCNCGIHTHKTEPQVLARILRDHGLFSPYERPDGRVWGTVKIWGRIVEHTEGYRAEYAYPGTLWCEDAKLAPIIAALYGVPCVVKAIERPKRDEVDDFVVSLIPSFFVGAPWTFNSYPPSVLAAPGPSVIVQPPAKYSVPPGQLDRWQRRLAQPLKTTVVDAKALLRAMVYAK